MSEDTAYREETLAPLGALINMESVTTGDALSPRGHVDDLREKRRLLGIEFKGDVIFPAVQYRNTEALRAIYRANEILAGAGYPPSTVDTWLADDNPTCSAYRRG